MALTQEDKMLLQMIDDKISRRKAEIKRQQELLDDDIAYRERIKDRNGGSPMPATPGAEPVKRKRRTKAEMEAAKATQSTAGPVVTNPNTEPMADHNDVPAIEVGATTAAA